MFAFAPLREILPDWAASRFPNFKALDEIGLTELEVAEDGVQLVAHGSVAWLKEIEFGVPGVDVVSVALLQKDGMTQIEFEHRVEPSFELRLRNLTAALRIKTDLLQRVRKDAAGKWVPDLDDKGKPKLPEIEMTAGEIVIDGDYDISFSGTPAIAFPPVMLGSTGIVLDVQRTELFLSSKQPNPPEPGFKGVAIKEAGIYFTGGMEVGLPQSFMLTNALIGSSGFSGRVDATWTAAGGSGTLFGVPFTIESLMVEFRQNAPIDSSIQGTLTLPFFDEEVRVEIRYGLDGGLLVRIDSTTEGPFHTLEKPGVLKIELDSLGFSVDDGVFTAMVSGELTPLFRATEGLKWPSFEVRNLTIDSTGRIDLDGGWLNIPDQKLLDFHGFKIEIAQLGFGRTDDGGKWIGFSGGLKLVDKLKAGASVEGLRITWYPDGRKRITLNGAGVGLKIPGVLELEGEVSYREMKLNGEDITRFDGDITLKLETPEMKIDGALVIGSSKGPQGHYNFMAIYCDVELPTGIPLANTGLGIYGFAGLFALQMEPNKKADEAWFSIDHGKSFYHRNEPGITDLKNKWDPRKGSFAVGAGITLGTISDNAYTFKGKFLLAIVIPGPIILLQGAASFLTKEDGEGQFRSLAVYDGRAGSVLIGLDAEYKTGKGGELIEIGGSMEAYYAFHDPRAWHLWLGKKEPREQRIRALFGRFVEANAYFMLDAHQLALGAWFGYAGAWGFGPLGVRLEAWAEGNALISFRPAHFRGDLWLHALIELTAFGFGFGISLDAIITANLFKPFHLRGEFRVGIKLPWPFKKKSLGATVVLEWGPRREAPPLPLPLTQVAVEHFKSTVVWPLSRGTQLLPPLLLPKWSNEDGFVQEPVGALEPDFSKVPVVPLDARISLTFGRSMHDAGKIGVNPQPVLPAEEDIGHPGKAPVAKVQYLLDAVQLNRRLANGAWAPVAQSPKSGALPALFGSWMPVPALPDSNSPNLGNTKLMLWSKSAYDFTRSSGSSWSEWISDTLPDYPCLPPLESEELCFGFGGLVPGSLVESPWTHKDDPRVTLSWGFGAASVNRRPIFRPLDERFRNIEEQPIPALPTLCFGEDAIRHELKIDPEMPVRSVRITLSPRPSRDVARAIFVTGSGSDAGVPVCADLRQHVAGTVANPWTHERVRFFLHGAKDELVPQGRLERWGDGALGLNAGYRLDIELPCASPWVELIVTHRPPFRIVAFNDHGVAVATHAPTASGVLTTETIRLEGTDITRVEVHAAGNEKLIHSVCYLCPRSGGGILATGFDSAGNTYGPFRPDGNVIEVKGRDMTEVIVTGDSGICIEQICVTPDAEAGQAVGRAEMMEHIREELERWQSEGAVLEPDTTYQLIVRTRIVPKAIADITLPATITPAEHAYFRTEGPPGLTQLLPPPGVPPEQFDSGLNDLVRYVRETDPPTVPPPGEKPILFTPFYRAYDVGVEFNENYVEQMYRSSARDLGLYLFDNSNQPARDAKGRLLVVGDQWSRASVTVSEKDLRWITQMNSATCLPEKLDPETFPRDGALLSREAERVLAPEMLHEARLIPLLLHDTFAAGPLGHEPRGWFVADSGANGPSSWMVAEAGEPASRFVEQLAAIGDATAARAGSMLVLSDGAAWSDYRVSVYARTPVRGAIGVVVRAHAADGYRFSLDAGVRRLVKIAGGVVTVLAEDHFAYRKDRDYRLSVEALGNVVRAYVDGEPVFDVTDATFATGSIALYTAQSAGVRFSDVVVDDLRGEAPVVYRFSLTTSRYANFHHHLHSFQDALWTKDLGTKDVAAMLAQAIPPQTFTLPAESEARAYEELADAILGQAARQNPERVEITRVTRDAAPPFYLLRSPEPLEPRRVALALARSDRKLASTEPPELLKLTEASLGASRPHDESVTLLVRDGADLTRQRIEVRQWPGAVAELQGDPVLWAERFRDASSLLRMTIDDAAGASAWRWEHGGIVETSGIGGGNEPELPGTCALAGDEAWDDFVLTADLRADAEGELGVVFRYRDAQNFYRVSVGAARSYRRLVQCRDGELSVLWEDGEGYTAGEPFRIEVEAIGTRLRGFIDGQALFDIHDEAHATGRAGVYVASNRGARCEHLEVRAPSLERRALLADRFGAGALDDWTFVSEMSVPADQAAQWTALPMFDLLSIGTAVTEGSDPEMPGIYALAGEASWTDVILQARVGLNNGAAGVVLRATDVDHYYRFSMTLTGRLLVKRTGGVTTVLWRDAAPYDPNRRNEVTFSAIGDELRVWLDGVPVLAVRDAELTAGRVGLFAWNEPVATFSAVHVWPGSQQFANWRFEETFASLDAAPWKFYDAAGADERDAWHVADGWLERNALPFPSRQHAFAISTADAVAECRLSVRCASPDGGAGVIVGWRDVASYTALWLGSGVAELVRVEANVAQTLWSGNTATMIESIVTIEQRESRIAAFIDGVPLFDIDATPIAGRFGLAVHASAGVSPRFGELRVAVPEWSCWYAFGEEEPLPPGTRLRLELAGPGAAIFPLFEKDAGLVLRSLAGAGERGRTRLPAGGATLRIAGPQGTGHVRGFLPDAAWSPIGMHVVRKADGTGCVLVPDDPKTQPDDAQLPPGDPLRLELLYVRDRAEAGRAMTQMGDHGPERVTLILQ